jgi:UrcA family protein
MSTVRNIAIGLLYGGMVLAAAASASAPVSFDSDKVVVSYADLDIDSKAGAQSLYWRLKRASALACDADGSRRPLREMTAAKNCYMDTLDELVSEIDSDLLTEIHAG